MEGDAMSGFDVETMPLASRIPSAPKAMLPRVRVAWQDASGAAKEVRIEKSAIVGSAPSAPVRIDDPLVSRLHAELTVQPDGLWVRDLASKNGSFIEGVRVASGQVPPGGRIRVGGTILKVIETWDAAPSEMWPEDSLGVLVGRSAPMRELFARIVRVATTSMPVLIRGEVGVGKELAARAIHDRSAFAGGPFVTVDGSGLGAFDFDVARGGTVFVDEVADLGAASEAALLRMLDAGTVRFVAATRHDLPTMVGEGAFREDLYFRLSVLPITVPPLRERLDDLPLLVAAFLPPEEHSAVTPALLEELRARPWRGNVRELRNFVERALAFGTDEALDLLPPSQAPSSPASARSLPRVSAEEPFKVVRDRWVVHLEREYLRAVLARTGGNVSAAADAAGLDRAYVYRLIRKHGL
jgi:transcriptional regulator with GAF, ATPase, and Fis domain